MAAFLAAALRMTWLLAFQPSRPVNAVALAEAIALDAEDLALVELDPPVPGLTSAVADTEQQADRDDVGIERPGAGCSFSGSGPRRPRRRAPQQRQADGEGSATSHAGLLRS